MRLLAVVGFLALLGCAAEPLPECDGRFHPHRSLSAEDRARVEAAVRSWNDLAGREIAVLEEGDPDDTTCAVRTVAEGSSEYNTIVPEAGGDFLGAHRKSDGSIVLVPTRMMSSAPGCAADLGSCVEAVALHELGHALGVPHVHTAPAVMSADGPLLLKFADADRAACVEAKVCAR